MNMGLPLVAIGPALMPTLDRCVRGVVCDRGWEKKSRPARLAKLVPSDPDAGLARLMTVGAAIKMGRRVTSRVHQLSRKRSLYERLVEACHEFDITPSEGRMCVRLLIAHMRGLLREEISLEEAEMVAGFRKADGSISEQFR